MTKKMDDRHLAGLRRTMFSGNRKRLQFERVYLVYVRGNHAVYQQDSGYPMDRPDYKIRVRPKT